MEKELANLGGVCAAALMKKDLALPIGKSSQILGICLWFKKKNLGIEYVYYYRTFWKLINRLANDFYSHTYSWYIGTLEFIKWRLRGWGIFFSLLNTHTHIFPPYPYTCFVPCTDLGTRYIRWNQKFEIFFKYSSGQLELIVWNLGNNQCKCHLNIVDT